MADEINRGGEAFPMAWPDSSPTPGMSLRQYYAGQALAGLCANPGGPFQANEMNGWNIVNCTEQDVARLCLRLADAMLAQEEAATNG